MIFQPLRHLFGRRQGRDTPARIPDGERYYVVGDIHGRSDLFDLLLEAIARDDRERDDADTTIVLLGDLIDRGPDSAGVVRRAIELTGERPTRCLAGNHEEMLLQSLDDTNMLRHFVKHGGRETILSYGISRDEYNSLTLDELRDRLPQLIPAEHLDFLRNLEELIVVGDYAFVHAGIDPARPLDEQTRHDMLWIRERFLRENSPHSHIIVHGHTIFDEVADNGNRIGIDTGAYQSGRLTALVLEGEGRSYINTVEHDGSIAIERTDR